MKTDYEIIKEAMKEEQKIWDTAEHRDEDVEITLMKKALSIQRKDFLVELALMMSPSDWKHYKETKVLKELRQQIDKKRNDLK